MRLINQNILRGPNYWSGTNLLLTQNRIELDANFAWPTIHQNQCEAFIKKQIPTFTGFLSENTHENVLVQTALLALALQNAAGCQVNYYQFKATIYPNIYNLVVAYQYEKAGILAIKKAIEIMANPGPVFEPIIEAIAHEIEKEKPNEAWINIMQLAQSLSIPYLYEPKPRKLQLGYGHKSMLVSESNTVADIKQAMEAGKIAGIPIIGISGSNGKTTTTRLIAHMLKTFGKTTGFTSSDGVYINHQIVEEGDTTGPASAHLVLGNTAVEVAVLESARGGIVRAGLGFTSCDIAVVTNVQNDHLGISDIETMEDLAQVKSVLVQTIKPGGWIILNANNPYTIAMAKVSKGNNAWFAISPQNTQIQLAIRKGEPVAYIENNEIIIQTGIEKIKLLPLSEVPITFNGTLGFMIENSLAACLAASQFGVPQEIIKTSLKTFYPSVAQTPGRMNLYEVQGCKLLVDFAHNPDGFAGIRDYLQKVEAPFKIGIIVGTGDRKDEDTLELGRLSAQMFDLTLIHQIKFLRGKKADELVSMLVSGMHLHNKDAKWMRIPDEAEPLAFALQQAKPGSFITALSDVLTNPEALVASLGSDRNA